MLFNSLEFLLFFPIVTALYFALPHRLRWAMLLIASCVFYMAFVPKYILILLGMILVDYVAGILIEGAAGTARRLFLAISLIANIGILAFFKYFNFLDSTLQSIAGLLGGHYRLSPLTILLPIGLSFHTFQAMSYTVEVYRGKQPAERHLGIYALYVMFYPQLVAGPIERPQNLLHQFREVHVLDYDRVCSGLTRMIWGLFKKMVIADRLGMFVDAAYESPSSYGRGSLLIATYCFAVQIYCDFSGYTDVALGAAQVMGFTLMENFDRPYASASVGEFWRRWHLSLSTWFKDYVYFPLGGNRVSMLRWVFNIMVVFLLSGLWHGASWTFVIWGALHGCFVVAERCTTGLRDELARLTRLDAYPRLRRAVGVAVTFHLVCFAWIFFRASTTRAALDMIRRIILPSPGDSLRLLSTAAIPVLPVVLCIFAWGQLHNPRRPISASIRAMPVWVRWPVYYSLMIACLYAGAATQKSFIYFQF
jgi:D-alanyl-lipoteichoic acid acyltransferase DltB (MBOAT superfamily)